MANYLKKIVLINENITNTNLENSFNNLCNRFNNPIRLNFNELVNRVFNLDNQDNLENHCDTDVFIDIYNQYINVCIIKDLPDAPFLVRVDGGIEQRLATGRASPTFMVYNTETSFGAFAQYEDSLKIYNLNQLLAMLIRHTGQNLPKQIIFENIMSSTDAQNYIRESVNEIKKIIIELTPEEAPIKFDEFDPLRQQEVRYLQEIDLSIFDNDIQAFMNYLNDTGILRRVKSFFCRTDQGKDRVISTGNDVKMLPTAFNIGECIIELSNLANNNPQLVNFASMNIFNNLREMTRHIGG